MEEIQDGIENVLEDFAKIQNIRKEGEKNMEKMNHEFFGELDLEKGIDDPTEDQLIVLWEEIVNDINTTLWYVKGEKISLELLDTFSKFLNHFTEYHQKALGALVNSLTEDNEYIVFHRDELELDVPEDAAKFVQSMNVTNIGLWVDGENVIIVDYMIAPEESDEILAVKFDENLDIVDISWES